MKFRAWDEYEKIMRYSKDNGMAYSDKRSEEYTFYFWFDERTGEIVAISESMPFAVTDDPYTMYDTIKHYHKVMVSTGLTDKNGVEIWEGDILRKEHFVRWSRKEGEITETLTSVVEWGGMGFHPKRIGKSSTYLMDMTQFEAIGNIFENPELLEEVNDGGDT